MTLVIATCTNRKRKPIHDSLHMAALPPAPIADLVGDWVQRVIAAPEAFPAREIYGGRSFREARIAADLLDAQMMVVSAGLGLISAEARVPPYACTVLISSPDSIVARVVGDYSVAEWWRSLGEASPFSQSLQQAALETDGLICAALSDAYIDMIAAELCALSDDLLTRLRLFTRAPLSRVPPVLRSFVMPYDDRLDGPDSLVRGTRGDFAGRALHHFAQFIVHKNDNRSSSEHSEAVLAAIAGWRMPTRFDRRRLEDSALLELLREHWQAEQGSTARLLRRFRDHLGVACEQGRFASLAHQVRNERA